MTGLDYAQALRAAQNELAVLVAEHDEREKRIMLLKQTIQALSGLCNKDEAPGMVGSLTEDIRSIFRVNKDWLSAMEVREQLKEIGYDESKYSNLLASVHIILKRLRESAELTPRLLGPDDKKVQYRWTPFVDFFKNNQSVKRVIPNDHSINKLAHSLKVRLPDKHGRSMQQYLADTTKKSGV